MKKIPTLFTRIFENGRKVGIKDEITLGCEEAFALGTATLKIDGSCCAIIDGELYKRYDAKHGKTPPEGAIPCCEPDPETGHWPHWVKADRDNPGDKWLIRAYEVTDDEEYTNGCVHLEDGTYEAIGPHFQGNPYALIHDILMMHGEIVLDVERTFEGVKKYLSENPIEGIVFWLNGEPVCKIKRSDFGYKWPTE